MKLLITLLLITVSGFCVAQKKDSLIFSAYERAEFAEYENTLRQIIKVYQQQDSAKNVFLRKFLIYNGVDLERIDSLKITSKGIQFILKQKNK